MIIVRLRGGLGNQLFQYAAGLALSIKHQTTLKLDPYTYSIHKYRKFELDNFNTKFQIADQNEINRCVGRFNFLRLANKLNHYMFSKKAFAQPHYHYLENFFDLPNDIYISGYWQSERYFKNIQTVILEQYTFKIQPDDQNLEYIEQFNQCNSVSIHVRMGDYLSMKKYNSFFGGLDDSYYKKAIKLIEEKMETPVFYIFSDNVAACKERFDPWLNARYIDHNSGDKSYLDLILMSRCKNQIIANSTFSWWAAWLNPNED